jgi:hypothetical protein
MVVCVLIDEKSELTETGEEDLGDGDERLNDRLRDGADETDSLKCWAAG